MNKSYNSLIKNFMKIANDGWIKGVNNNSNSISPTFKKDSDSMFILDYEGIEIKCKSRFSNYPITPFTQAFNGPYLYQTNEILHKYGKFDYQYKI